MPTESPRPAARENPLHNFLLNVILPVVALSVLSKDGGRPWHLGPVLGMALAVAMPLGYGIWFAVRNRRANAFSLIGLGSVLLTGGITLLAWRPDGSIHPQAALMFASKEASIPFILGVCVLVSHWTRSPLVRVLLFNPEIFDVPRIEAAVRERGREREFRALLWHVALAFGGSFLISTGLNFVLAMHFLGGLDTTALNARELYNDAVGRQTFWGFIVIGGPIFIMLAVTLFWLVKRLGQITGLDQEQLLHPR
jgi:hypothetical protein